MTRSLTRLHICRHGWSEALAAELTRTLPRSSHRIGSKARVESELSPEDASAAPILGFCRQCLPNPVAIEALTIAQWARIIGDRIVSGLWDHPDPWRLHVFPEEPGTGLEGKCRLIRQEALADVKERRRRVWKLRSIGDDGVPSLAETLVQVALQSPNAGWTSICPAAERTRLEHCLSRFSGGVVSIPEDREAPSQAHQKLREAEFRLGRWFESGETCVDLGGSPGGWTWVAVERGANVLAIDRSPLREDLMSHPRVTFQKGDAFLFRPERPVDWLLCDVIAFPPRILELLDRWLSEGWCRRFCVTIKFRGRDDDAILEDFKRLLSARCGRFGLRQLDSNRNEVTAYGE